MIRKTQFSIKQNNEESFFDELDKTEFRCLYADSGSLIENKIPWHWHTAVEIDYVAGCDVEFEFLGESFCVPHGSAVFINAGAIHSYHPQKTQNCKVYAILFEPNFISGNYRNSVFERYITPIIRSKQNAILISQKTTDFQCLIKKIEKIIQVFEEEPEYYEFLLRAQLSECWCLILEFLKKENLLVQSKGDDAQRICKMMNYIHLNYNKKISLCDIATVASIGTRECSRCFQRSIGRSPIEYLIEYRIQMAILQLTTTNCNVTEISENCGFSSIGYFGKVFKQYTGCSPLQYRKSKTSGIDRNND